MRQQDDDRALFMISVAAELAGMHPQTLRMYERRGLVRPQRTAKNTRRYSQRDVERLMRIQQLTEIGLNLAGVERVLAMEEQMLAMAAEVQRLQARLEEAAAVMHREIERVERSHRFELVPVSRTQIVPLGRRRRRA
jgi:MerR family transcriptional regulator, heat shock protein HspR